MMQSEKPVERSEPQPQTELKRILGSLLFASRKPASVSELCETLLASGSENGGTPFPDAGEREIRETLQQIKIQLDETNLGFVLVETAGGFRLQTDSRCGYWVRRWLNMEKPSRLSKPALETLAIVAYRQPVTRAEIEALRGVNVDAMMRHLLELQLIRIVARSELPGRPLMYGTTKLFLEHFGLEGIDNLPGIEQLSRIEANRQQAAEAQPVSPEPDPAAETEEKA